MTARGSAVQQAPMQQPDVGRIAAFTAIRRGARSFVSVLRSAYRIAGDALIMYKMMRSEEVMTRFGGRRADHDDAMDRWGNRGRD